MNSTISFVVKGAKNTVTTEAKRPLIDVLREDLGLAGTKYGCGEGQCGDYGGIRLTLSRATLRIVIRNEFSITSECG